MDGYRSRGACANALSSAAQIARLLEVRTLIVELYARQAVRGGLIPLLKQLSQLLFRLLSLFHLPIPAKRSLQSVQCRLIVGIQVHRFPQVQDGRMGLSLVKIL
jgi:hypothetical protein